MPERQQLIQQKLFRMEATALFARLETQAVSGAWWFFTEARRTGYSARTDKSIGLDRAWLRMDYVLQGIPFELYVESKGVGEWRISLDIEGKERENKLLEMLQPLCQEGFDVGAGNENLERQMNFSLGLYGACLMHLIIRPPQGVSILTSAMRLMDYLDGLNRAFPTPLPPAAQADDDDYGFDTDVNFGDWQTWK